MQRLCEKSIFSKQESEYVSYRDKEIQECTFKPQLYESRHYKTAHTAIGSRRGSNKSCSKPDTSVKLQKPSEQMTFEITIAKGVVKTMKYEIGSDADVVAMSFCRENGLPRGMRDKLKSEILKGLSVYLESHKNV